MTAMLAGAASVAERLEAEAHAAHCPRCAATLRDLVVASAALARAYAPLRLRTAALSPARVHLALRMPPTVPAAFRFSRIAARINEVGVAAAVTAFAFVGLVSAAPPHAILDDAAAPAAVAPARIAPSSDDQSTTRWFRLGRYAPQTDMLGSDAPSATDSDEPAKISKPDRAGLVR
jgi:anti-sigma factor RsiW